jgi:hypothetical protein
VPALLKDAILTAAENADEQGLVGYLDKQALANGAGGGPLEIGWLPPQMPEDEHRKKASWLGTSRA